ncbi:MAG TPA: hypothetical protein VFD27_20365, partial [Chthoniobacteraceae bacterium]|nr:hypothetical protein [Chthoniobacteraceae bacterium]
GGGGNDSIQRAADSGSRRYQRSITAAEWVATVGDPELRRQSALGVFWPWWQNDPRAALEWMRQLDGADPEWHAHFLRRVK